MSHDTKISVLKLGGILAAIASLIGVLAYARPYVDLPDRVGRAEVRLEHVEAERRTDRELLIRIDENVQALKAKK